MNADSVVTQLGGLATRSELLSLCTPRQIRAGVEAGDVVRLGRGVYALPGGDAATHARAALGGVISHQSAAQWWRWRLKHPPEEPVITVGRKRKLSAERRAGIDVRYADLAPSHVVQGTVTDPVTTVIACARSLPFDEALAIADSALRSGEVTRESLLLGAAMSPRTGRRTAIRVAEAADGRADNLFESVVRAISLEVPSLHLEPQVRVAPGITPDLVDSELLLIVECDSWMFHAEKSAFRRDMERYNTLVLRGWRVLRIGWEHAMKHPDYVRDVLATAARRT